MYNTTPLELSSSFEKYVEFESWKYVEILH